MIYDIKKTLILTSLMKIFITGSNFYDHSNFEWETQNTEYGDVEWLRGKGKYSEIILLPRHGKNHKNLPNHINYLANFSAIQNINPEFVVSFSVCGVLDKNIPLAKPIIPNDFFFPENRLPDGKICTVFQKNDAQKGHLIPVSNYFHSGLQDDLGKNFSEKFTGTYIHVNGPRFNSKTEIQFFQNLGGNIISQTCGPEIIMTNELQIPFGMVCFGVDYANGVSDTPTTPEELGKNLGKSTEVFKEIVDGFIGKEKKYLFENFLFEI